ncbi:MAG: exodeoxyribonuclease VII large subunit [Pirellulaceae bacterium]|nr:exodeoxyribonuclease VII large subunit [Pirellulaceae bacterium]
MSSPKVFSVAQLSQLLKNVLEVEFPEVWVKGEISNLSQPQSGHCYFTLKDDTAQIRGVIWRTTAARMKFQPKDGMQIVCSGHIDLYPPRGTYQLVVRFAEPIGLGPLQMAFRQLHEKLKKEGLFDPAHKIELPSIPRRIAVITSPTGAAIRDFLQVLKRRWNQSEVTIIPTRVQGDGADSEIANAIENANRIRPRFDLIVLTRGGGSMEDLWSFNEESVVRAIYQSTLPVLSAIGHEIDVTLSDLVADQRALTPSEAAEKIVPSAQEMSRRLSQHRDYLNQFLFSLLQNSLDELRRIESRPVFRRPMEFIRNFQRRVDDLENSANRSIKNTLANQTQHIAHMARQLEAVSPLAVLQRGYSVTQKTDDDNTLVDRIESVQQGDLIRTQVTNGRIFSRVEKLESGDESSRPPK